LPSKFKQPLSHSTWQVPERDPASHSHVTNPTLLVEVLSNATESYDQGEKLDHYKQIPSAKTVVLVNHKKPEIAVCSRIDNQWARQVYTSGATIALPSVGAEIKLDDVYAAAENA